MDVEDDLEDTSGYEASNEAALGDFSIFSGCSFTNSHVSLDTLRPFHRQLTERPQVRRKAKTTPSSTDERYQSSPTPPNLSRMSTERLEFRSQVRHKALSTDSDFSASSLSLELKRHRSIHSLTEMIIGKTAREVAERAQDEMLIKAGLQKSPEQLIKKVARPDVTEEKVPVYIGRSIKVCDSCRRKKVHSGLIQLCSISSH